MDLRSLYYNPRTGLSSLYKFFQRAKSQGYSNKEVAEFLARQEAYQINKQIQKLPVYFPIWGMPHSYQADTIDMGNKEYKGWRYILCIINVRTRKAWAIPCKKKSEETDLFITWLKDNPKVKTLQTDLGTEFSKKLSKYCEDNKITLRVVRKAQSTDQGKVERFNGTLRRLITMYCSAFKTDDWVSGLPKLMMNYNSRFHSAIGTSPNQATETTSNAKNFAQYQKAQKEFDRFSIGERVRKLIYNSVFTKGKQRWSKEIYTIDDIRNHEFLLGDKWVKHWEVQTIEDPEFAPVPVIDTRVDVTKTKKIARGIRKEGVSGTNITEAPREKQVAKTFVAEPAPNPRTLDRSGLAPKKSRGTRAAPIVEYTQAKLGTSRFQIGKVFKEGNKFFSRYENGRVMEYTPEELIQYRFPLTKADRKKFPSVVKRLLVPSA